MRDDTLRVAVLGSGRMGRQVVDVIRDTPQCDIAGVWSRSTGSDLTALLDAADVAIDFTVPEATSAVVAAAAARKTPLVCGVTGIGPDDEQAIAEAATRIPLLYDRNMSRGIGVMAQLVRQAARLLGSDFTAAITETHHVHKKDAPSGTAIALREALGDDSIGIESRREGEVFGDHLVRFESASESLGIRHSVGDRRVFAEGAVAAALWLQDKPPGRYRMADLWS